MGRWGRNESLLLSVPKPLRLFWLRGGLPLTRSFFIPWDGIDSRDGVLAGMRFDGEMVGWWVALHCAEEVCTGRLHTRREEYNLCSPSSAGC
jgi:hypothetical protein